MKAIINLSHTIIRPTAIKGFLPNLLIAIPRIIAGLLLTLDFGSSKFGMPWSQSEEPLGLFRVAAWFPEDVASYGGLFAMFPVFFAWMGAASEAIGGLFLAIGFKTRVASFLIMCTMLVAIFFQKWGEGTWGMLPAMGFLWVSIYGLVLGSGKFGLDYLLSRCLFQKWKSVSEHA